MKSRIYVIICIAIIASIKLQAQDSIYTRSIIKHLTDKSFSGRGYVNKGDLKAASFLKKEFIKIGLVAGSNNFYQNFSFSVNTFPSKLNISINDHLLFPGKDYIIDPSSSGIKGTFTIKVINHSPTYYISENFQNVILLIDTSGNGKIFTTDSVRLWENNPLNAAGLIFISEKKLTWSVSTTVDSIFKFHILRNAIPLNPVKIKLNIVNEFIPKHHTQNVVAIIPGFSIPDSFIFITAHYDHLGKMGKHTYFPGANDNVSGVSMLLNLAKYFKQSKNQIKYTMVFIAFAGEEAGLIGSKYYTDHPIVDLKKINFLMNLDLLGTGEDGLMVVNGDIYTEAFSSLEKINSEHQYLKTISKRGAAHNSDHYYFSEKGVPSFFCYTMGGIAAYHDIYDKANTLPLTKYKEVFSLLHDFIKSR